MARGMTMDELELIKMAVFKIGETARRMDALANAAQSPRGRQLLATLAQLLAVQEQELRASVDDARSAPAPQPSSPPNLAVYGDQPKRGTEMTPAAGRVVKHIRRLVPLTRRRGQGRLSIARAAQ